ncbi:MAG: flagellar FliJ family protein [Rhodothermales bacterium]
MAGKKFRFSLESVLKLRKYETERARQSLGRATIARKNQEEQVDDLRQRLSNLPGVTPGKVDPLSLRRQAAFREDAERHYDQACEKLHSLSQREGKAREQLRSRHGAEESLHTLRRREKGQHKKEQDDAEGAFLDEQAISGFHRKRGLAALRRSKA